MKLIPLYICTLSFVLFSCKDKSVQINNKLSLTEKHQEYLKKYYTEDKNMFLDSVLLSFNELIQQNEKYNTSHSIYKYEKLNFYLDNNYYKQALEEFDSLYPHFSKIDHKLFKIALEIKLNYNNTDKKLNDLYRDNLSYNFDYIEDKVAFILLKYNLHGKSQALNTLNEYMSDSTLTEIKIERFKDVKILIDRFSPKEALFHHFYIDN